MANKKSGKGTGWEEPVIQNLPLVLQNFESPLQKTDESQDSQSDLGTGGRFTVNFHLLNGRPTVGKKPLGLEDSIWDQLQRQILKGEGLPDTKTRYDHLEFLETFCLLGLEFTIDAGDPNAVNLGRVENQFKDIAFAISHSDGIPWKLLDWNTASSFVKLTLSKASNWTLGLWNRRNGDQQLIETCSPQSLESGQVERVDETGIWEAKSQFESIILPPGFFHVSSCVPHFDGIDQVENLIAHFSSAISQLSTANLNESHRRTKLVSDDFRRGPTITEVFWLNLTSPAILGMLGLQSRSTLEPESADHQTSLSEAEITELRPAIDALREVVGTDGFKLAKANAHEFRINALRKATLAQFQAYLESCAGLTGDKMIEAGAVVQRLCQTLQVVLVESGKSLDILGKGDVFTFRSGSPSSKRTPVLRAASLAESLKKGQKLVEFLSWQVVPLENLEPHLIEIVFRRWEAAIRGKRTVKKAFKKLSASDQIDAGKKGGMARANALSKDQRSKIAKKAAGKRWNK